MKTMKKPGIKTQYIYTFGKGEADGDRTMRDLLGGKGANLAEMSAIGLPVPAGADEEAARGQFQQMLLSSPSMRIAGGTDEIQRNIISERILGMPRS
jgi:alkylation response protein AidB-like acyl-CoA dehydrogenase